MNEKPSVSQKITGDYNKQYNVCGNYTVNKYYIKNEISLSEFRAFDERLLSTPPNLFLKDIVQYYLQHHGFNSIEELNELSLNE